MRAFTERGNQELGAKKEDPAVEVANCVTGATETMTLGRFFSGFERREKGPETLRLKDWPPRTDFRKLAPRHHVDFVEMCPFPEYSNIADGPFNLATKICRSAIPPDLGPKGYIGYGYEEERADMTADGQAGGDSITKLHEDLSDAVNILIQCFDADSQEKTTEKPGAVWDIFRVQDVGTLSEWLGAKRRAGALKYLPARRDREGMKHDIHGQWAYLMEGELRELKRDTGVEPWRFDHFGREAVFIPGGAAHQVRNKRSCTKVAVDFVSCETVRRALETPPHHHHHHTRTLRPLRPPARPLACPRANAFLPPLLSHAR